MKNKRLLVIGALSIVTVALYVFYAGLLFFSINKPLERQTAPRIDDHFSNPYRIEILDEAEARLISKYDTVTLLMENAYALADESVIFIKQKP
jgi:hypothetical protein